MRITNFLPIFLLSQFSSASENEKRGLKIIKVTQTVDNTVTNTRVVDSPTSTVVNWSTLTTTSTTTHYTSTFTSTIFGDVYTYVSVFSSVVAVVDNESAVIDVPTETAHIETVSTLKAMSSSTTLAATIKSEVETLEVSSKSLSAITTIEPSTVDILTTSVDISSATAEVSLPTITPVPVVTPTTSTEAIEEGASAVTEITSFPSIWEGYTLGDITTNVVSNSICIVDYDYYSQDYTETIFSTSLVYQTVTV